MTEISPDVLWEFIEWSKQTQEKTPEEFLRQRRNRIYANRVCWILDNEDTVMEDWSTGDVIDYLMYGGGDNVQEDSENPNPALTAIVARVTGE